MLAKGKQFLFLIKYPRFISGKSLFDHGRKTNIYVKDPLSFKTWLFRNSLQVRDDDRSNLQRLLEHRSNVVLLE